MKKLNDRARRCCLYCRWRPTRLVMGVRQVDDRAVDEVVKHFETAHRLLPVQMDVAIVCECGTEMDKTSTRPTGGGEKHYYRCPACKAEGYAKAEILSATRPVSQVDLRDLAPDLYPTDLSRFFN